MPQNLGLVICQSKLIWFCSLNINPKHILSIDNDRSHQDESNGIFSFSSDHWKYFQILKNGSNLSTFDDDFIKEENLILQGHRHI